MTLRHIIFKIGQKMPSKIADNILLNIPFLYRTKFLNYEAGTSHEQQRLLKNAIIEIRNVKGDIIECGSNRCGTTVILAKFLKENNIDKRIFALDSFSGFIPEEISKEIEEKKTDFPKNSYHYNTYEYVIKKIRKLNLDDIIKIKKGYFQETLPNLNNIFSFGFIDCDLGASIKYATNHIWKKLSVNGTLFFHDYGFNRYSSVKPTVDKFVKENINEIKRHGPIYGMYYVQKK